MKRCLPLLVLLGALGGCATYACTLVPCMSGLLVNFTERPTAPYHVDARTQGGGVYSYDCPDIARCSLAPLLEGYLPAYATLTVTYQGRSATTTVQPSYSDSYPNGRDCGGSCRVGTVALALP